MSTQSRFDALVDRTGGPDACHLWLGANNGRHGHLQVGTKFVRAHRVAWILVHGDPPPDRPCVLHNCPNGDNGMCVNVKHLWVGTVAQNNADRKRKGRNGKPERAKVDCALVERARSLIAGGVTQTAAAKILGVTQPRLSVELKRALQQA